MRLVEKFKVVGLGTSADFTGGFTADSINMANYHSVMFVLTFGAITGAGPFVLTIKSGASAGTQTTAETFAYRYGSAAMGAASADVYTAWSTSAGLNMVVATLTERCFIAEIDASAITANQPWLTLAFDNGADSGLVGATAILVPRYASNDMPTAI
jgi:hypothetical protein